VLSRPSDEQVARLVKEHHIIGIADPLPRNSADLFLRLGNGDVLTLWAASDYGPAYWTLEPCDATIAARSTESRAPN
jgi:hypothetical protein